MSGNNMFYTVMRVKGRYYLYKGIYVNGRKKLIYVGPCDAAEQLLSERRSSGAAPRKALKLEQPIGFGARRLAWLGRRPHTAEVRGSSPRGPTSIAT